MMDTVSEARLEFVAPPLAAKVRQMATMLASEDINIRVVQGLRTWQQQDALYAQGRTAPGKIVTNVKGGYSWHCFGMAADVVPSKFVPDQPYSPDWNASDPRWQRMTAVGQSLGLDPGSLWRTFPDAPHFQYVGRFSANEPSDEVRQLFQSEGGIQAVWKSSGILDDPSEAITT